MTDKNFTIVPSFGMSGEKQSIFIVNNYKKISKIGQKGNFSAYLLNDNGTRISLHIDKIESERIRTDLQDNNYEIKKIFCSVDIPKLKSQDKNNRIFDIVILVDELVIEIIKSAFIIYDSIAVLVHGVLSSPQIWDGLIYPNIENVLFLPFDYEKWNHMPAIFVLSSFNNFISEKLQNKGYLGRFDIICHSMGAQITRLWMMNYPDNNNCNAKSIRQWIGIAPVNHGSANADGFLANICAFFLKRPAFSQLKTNSFTTELLEKNEINESNNTVRYRIIVGYNGKRIRFFYYWYETTLIPNFLLRFMKHLGLSSGLPIPLSFNGISKSYISSQKMYYNTYYGDGVVANFLSQLFYASVDAFEGLNHSTIVKNDEVCALLKEYLINNPIVNKKSDFKDLVENDLKSHLRNKNLFFF